MKWKTCVFDNFDSDSLWLVVSHETNKTVSLIICYHYSNHGIRYYVIVVAMVGEYVIGVVVLYCGKIMCCKNASTTNTIKILGFRNCKKSYM